ncbi:MAG: transcriptional regulator [Clostridiales bacterium]|nr:transcriptional regulator [Clostridiales bacterium]
MARQVTKASENMYCQARLKAAKWNKKLLTRNGAAEVIGCVTGESITKYELGLTRPPHDMVALMADAYNSPELVLWYCANECPLGNSCREVPDMPAERALIRLQNSAVNLDDALSQMSKIMDDGKLDDEEVLLLPQLKEQLLEVRRRIDENLVAIEKAEKSGHFS